MLKYSECIQVPISCCAKATRNDDGNVEIGAADNTECQNAAAAGSGPNTSIYYNKVSASTLYRLSDYKWPQTDTPGSVKRPHFYYSMLLW